MVATIKASVWNKQTKQKIISISIVIFRAVKIKSNVFYHNGGHVSSIFNFYHYLFLFWWVIKNESV